MSQTIEVLNGQIPPANVGNTTAQWNANQIQGTSVDASAIADQYVLKYSSSGNKIIYGPGGGTGGILANQIVVFPSNTAAFPSYGVQSFGTDLNAAWASIPRSDDSYLQHCNNWMVVIPAGVYTPTTNNLPITGTTVTTYSGFGVDTRNLIIDWGYNWNVFQMTGATHGTTTLDTLTNTTQLYAGMLVTGLDIPDGTYIDHIINSTSVALTQAATGTVSSNYYTFTDANKSLIGKTITGPGIPINTTITAIGALTGIFTSPVGFVQGSNIVTVSSSTQFWLGQTIQKEGTIPCSYITSIPDATHIVISNNALVTNASSTITPVSTVYVKLSNAATLDSRNVNFNVNVPLQVTGTTDGTTNVITAVNYVANDMVGQTITGSGIPSTTTVTAISYNATTNLGTLTISNNTTSAATSVLSMQLPDRFICDTNRRRIVNLCLGPVELGKMYAAEPGVGYPNFTYPSSGGATGTGSNGFWSPQPGADHFIDLHIQLSEMFYTSGVRNGWSWSSLPVHDEANTTHESYRAKSRISGTIKFLDMISAIQCSWTLADTEVFGNPRWMTYSTQTGTTHGTTTLDGLTSTAGLMTGQAISGTGIQSNTYIQSITSNTALVMTRIANNSASNTMTFSYVLPSTVSIDATSINNALGLYTSIYKCRIRGSFIANFLNASTTYHCELADVEHCDFSGFVGVQGYDKIQNSAFKAGMYWNANTANFDNYGFYDCMFTSTAAFNAGTTSAPLRMDASTNYWSKVAPISLGANTVKLLMNDATSNAANLTTQGADITTTTLFTPASDGVYRINVYHSCTTADVTAGTIAATIGWKDDSTTQSLTLSSINLITQGSYVQQSIVTKCKSGQPITYAAAITGIYGAAKYSLYVNVENIT